MSTLVADYMKMKRSLKRLREKAKDEGRVVSVHTEQGYSQALERLFNCMNKEEQKLVWQLEDENGG